MNRAARYIAFLLVFAAVLAVTGGGLAYAFIILSFVVWIPLAWALQLAAPGLAVGLASAFKAYHFYILIAVLFISAFGLDRISPGLSKWLARSGLICCCLVIAVSMTPAGIGR